MRSFALVLLAVTLGAAPALGAQERPSRAPNAAQRDSLEERVRARMAQMLRVQVGLNDEQIRQLQATSRRFEGQRRALFAEERRVRGELGRILETRDTTQDARLAVLLDQTLKLQRDRLDLLEAEQKELATFLTPTQRARVFGIEEQIRRRMMEMRQRAPDPRQGTRRPTGATPGQPRRPL
jgi:periplasmic protein CpxP/Spy